MASHQARVVVNDVNSARAQETARMIVDAGGQAVACAEDVKHFCQDAQPRDGQVLQCLQDHVQELSDECYATLPKGELLLRN